MHAPLPRPPQRAEPLVIAALAVACVFVLTWRWVGYQGHDDLYYARAALDWRDHFPAVGHDHWALRYPLVLPMAAALALFGQSLFALAVPTLLAYVAWLVFSYLCLRAWSGWPTAALATLAAILTPEFPVQATYANPDIMELAFVMAAFWAHQSALSQPDRTLPLLHCGALAALAFLTRETSAALVLYFGFLCLVRPGMPRRHYAYIALTFACVVSAEFFYLGLRTGDVLYRLHLSATHDQVNRAAQATAAATAGHALDSEGVLAGSPAYQLVSVLFISQKYGLLFVLAPFAAWFALRRDRFMPRERRLVIDSCLLALAFIVFIAFAETKLYIVPRYFTAPAGAALIPLSIAAAAMFRAAASRAAAATALFAALTLPLLAIENTNPLFAVHRLVAFAAASPETLHTDPATGAEAAIPLAFAHLTARVSTNPPPPGALVALPENAAATCLASRTCGFKGGMAPFTPTQAWILIRREPAPTPLLGSLAHLIPSLPPDIRHKLEAPNPALIVYRTPRPSSSQAPTN